jgi:glycerophosphoryl diester phosphodiesterase
LVVIHDFSLDTTTDGTGQVRNKSLAELKELDAGIRFDPAFAGQQIPTLQEVIDTIGHRLLLNIELKTAGWRDDGLAAGVVRAIEDNHLLDRTIVSSFNPLALRWVNRLNPWVPIGLLYCPDMPLPLRRPWARHLLQLDAVHPDQTMLDDKYMDWARRRGYRVNTWTVDDPGRMWQLMRLEVDTIITNRPDLLRQVLQTGRGDGPVPDAGLPPSFRSRGG